ncbi:MAG: hypothetical protein J6Z06_02470 [Lachnospiraceae bacterium]|nr:hypothetical protein [Lachnospiraceae bacterium]
MSEEKRICRKCLLSEQGEEGRVQLDKYLAVIHKEDKADDAVYEKRLERCRTCEQLSVDATCLSCGCYVEFRAILRRGKCPKHYW